MTPEDLRWAVEQLSTFVTANRLDIVYQFMPDEGRRLQKIVNQVLIEAEYRRAIARAKNYEDQQVAEADKRYSDQLEQLRKHYGIPPEQFEG